MKEASEMGVRTVLQALAYEAFCNEYERVFVEMNREGGR